MARESIQKTGEHTAPVGTPVEGQPLPRILLPVGTSGREVGRVGEHEIERPKPRNEVGPHRLDRKPLLPGPMEEETERRRISVRRHHPARPVSCGDEACEAATAPDLEDVIPRARSGESREETGVFPDRVDLSYFVGSSR